MRQLLFSKIEKTNALSPYKLCKAPVQRFVLWQFVLHNNLHYLRQWSTKNWRFEVKFNNTLKSKFLASDGVTFKSDYQSIFRLDLLFGVKSKTELAIINYFKDFSYLI